VAVGRGVHVRCSAVAAVVGSSARAASSRKRRTRGSKRTMSREIDDKLCEASKRGIVWEMERLMAAGANPNVNEGKVGKTPLQLAARWGRGPAIAALLKAGAHVDGASSAGITALMSAALSGHSSLILALIAAGADGHRADEGGDTALHVASMNGNLDAARVLLESGAKADVRNKEGKRPIDVVRPAAKALACRCFE